MHSVQTFNQSDEATGYPEIDGCQFGMLGRWPWKERRANVDNIFYSSQYWTMLLLIEDFLYITKAYYII